MPNNEIKKIQQIRERLAKATTWPWKNDGIDRFSEDDGYVHVVSAPSNPIVAEVMCECDEKKQHPFPYPCVQAVADAELIANAPSDIEYLLAALSEMRTVALREAAEIAKECKESHMSSYAVAACNLTCDQIAAAILRRIDK